MDNHNNVNDSTVGEDKDGAEQTIYDIASSAASQFLTNQTQTSLPAESSAARTRNELHALRYEHMEFNDFLVASQEELHNYITNGVPLPNAQGRVEDWRKAAEEKEGKDGEVRRERAQQQQQQRLQQEQLQKLQQKQQQKQQQQQQKESSWGLIGGGGGGAPNAVMLDEVLSKQAAWRLQEEGLPKRTTSTTAAAVGTPAQNRMSLWSSSSSGSSSYEWPESIAEYNYPSVFSSSSSGSTSVSTGVGHSSSASSPNFTAVRFNNRPLPPNPSQQQQQPQQPVASSLTSISTIQSGPSTASLELDLHPVPYATMIAYGYLSNWSTDQTFISLFSLQEYYQTRGLSLPKEPVVSFEEVERILWVFHSKKGERQKKVMQEEVMDWLVEIEIDEKMFGWMAERGFGGFYHNADWRG